jgi:hypothetical protein
MINLIYGVEVTIRKQRERGRATPSKNLHSRNSLAHSPFLCIHAPTVLVPQYTSFNGVITGRLAFSQMKTISAICNI